MAMNTRISPKSLRLAVSVVAGALALLILLFVLINLGKILTIKSYARRAVEPQRGQSEVVRFLSDGRLLVGDLLIPEADPHGYVVFAHGSRPAGRDHLLPRQLVPLLSRNYVVLAFDFRGYGESEGLGPYERGMTLDFSPDITAAVEYLSARFGTPEDEVVLIGHSFGSLSVLLASRELATGRVVAIGAGDPERLFDSRESANHEMNKLSKLGLEVPVEEVKALYRPLFADNLLARCFPGRTTLISGEFESGLSTLSSYVEGLNDRCGSEIEVVIVPSVGHMIWTEQRGDWKFRFLSIFVDEDEWIRALAGVILENLEH